MVAAGAPRVDALLASVRDRVACWKGMIKIVELVELNFTGDAEEGTTIEGIKTSMELFLPMFKVDVLSLSLTLSVYSSSWLFKALVIEDVGS